MSTPTQTTAPAVQKREEQGQSTPSGSGGSSSRYAAPGVSRDFLRGASYDAAATSLTPEGGAGLKYERSLAPGSGAPVQLEEAPGTSPAEKLTAWQQLTQGAKGYDVTGKGAHGYEKHTEDAKDGSYKKGDYKTDASGQKVLGGNYGYVKGTGAGWGNRKGDLPQWKDAKDHSKGKADAANEKVSLSDVTGIPEPDLKHIKSVAKNEVKGAYGTYAGYDVKYGSASEAKNDWGVGLNLGKHDTSKKIDPGKLYKVDGPNGYYQAGARADAYAGIKGKVEGAYGEASAGAKANAYGYAGLSGKYGINQDGASAQGAIGAGVGVGVSADADAKTKGLKIAGVTDPLTAGVGVHGEANAWAKAGAGGGAYLTKDKIGLVGRAGIGAVAEAKANIHGHVGPVSGTYEVGVLAGAGAGIEGGILFENGKLVIGARAYAALGYGVSTGGKIVIDLKQSYEIGVALLKKARDLGIEGARRAFAAADADNDGKLSLNDAATHGSNAMKGGANVIASGIRGGIRALDGDGDGKFDFRKDMGAHAENAGKAIHQAGKDIYKRGEQLVDSAVKSGRKALQNARDAVDVDGDGKITFKDAGAAYDKVAARVERTVDAASKAVDHAVDEAHQWGKDRLNDAHDAVKAAHKFADRTGDGKLGLDDAMLAGKEIYAGGRDLAQRGVKAAGEMVDSGVKRAGELYDAGVKRGGELVDAGVKRAGELYKSGSQAVHNAGKAAHKALDRDGDGQLGIGDAIAGAQQAGQAIQDVANRTGKAIEDGYNRAVKAAQGAQKAVFTAADVNKDGKVDAADAAAAARQAQQAAERARQRAAAWAAEQKRRASEALKTAQKRATEIAHQAHKAIDRTGDGKIGLDDVAQGGRELRDAAVKQFNQTRKAVVQRATQAYTSARESITQAGTTLRDGYNSARETVGSALHEAREFFGTPPW
ncbi:MAG: hypothetical protein EP329_01955 [Deltaproteobacteria bacterium]|nr:MAG: hypothetical protein EP329_01955 [Deltaproteobacteria bacterium]